MGLFLQGDMSLQMVAYKGPQSVDGKSVRVVPVASHWLWGPVCVCVGGATLQFLPGQLHLFLCNSRVFSSCQFSNSISTSSCRSAVRGLVGPGGWDRFHLSLAGVCCLEAIRHHLVGLAGGAMVGLVPVLSRWGLVRSCLGTLLCLLVSI